MNTARIRLLLIEDCPADARLIEIMLQQSQALDIHFSWADNLTAGIERLRAAPFDVVLLDLGLPESTGLDTLRIVSRETSVPTLVVMSGSSDEEVALQALQAGAQDYLIKGHVDGASLARSIRYAIGRRQAEEALRARTAEQRQQAKYLRTLIDMLPMFAWLKDTRSNFLTVNQAMAAACGTTPQAMEGRSDLDFWPSDRAQAFRTDDVQVMSSLQRQTAEEMLATVDGDVWVETYKVPVLDEDGTVLGTVGVARDIRERKAVEAAHRAALAEAERLARQRSAFLAQMSHELRTPLNGILGFAQLLQQDKGLNERQVRGLKIIRESGQHLLALINDILDLAHIDAAKVELNPTDIALGPFLAVVADIVRVKAEEKSLLFVERFTPDLPRSVRADEKRLRQVLLNLLSNAVKFTDSGEVVLAVTAENLAPTTVRLRCEVRDSGIGMTASQRDRLFKPFEQVSEVGRRDGGSGLGLAISRELVRLMGGDIEVSTEAGRGSRFWFEVDLPLGVQRRFEQPMRGQPTGYAGPRRRVLVVDDVPQNRAVLVESLNVLGFDLAEAADGQQALACVQELRPDLVVMDVTMPVMDGLEATRRIRKSPALAQIAIMASSGSTSHETRTECLRAGADAFLPKPIDHQTLLAETARLLSLTWTY
ncbi:MAG: response regulator [Vitreoscilla sp.]